ncbi:MAG: hypothetical protein IJ137_05755 [Eubacterium sp.]|nr:hypothetical protein [Eubacterium sp.]
MSTIEAYPFHPLTEEKVLSDLAVSRQQRTSGKGRRIKDAIKEMRREHGFT